MLRIPVVTFHTWSGNTLEGRGVEPDYAVELSRDGLKEGVDIQLGEACQIIRDL